MTDKEMLSNSSHYKYCIVPNCKNTVITAPTKVYINVPSNPLKRKQWCETIGCPDKKLRKISHVCEDHFDLKNDLENYMQWKVVGSPKILKESALPRYALSSRTALSDNTNLSISYLNLQQSHHVDVSLKNQSSSDSKNKLQKKIFMDSKYTQCSVEMEHQYVQASPKMLFKYCQVKPKNLSCNAEVQCMLLSPYQPVQKLPVIEKQVEKLKIDNTMESDASGNIDSTSASYIPSSSATSSNSEIKKLEFQCFKDSVYECFTKRLIEDNPSLFLGLNKDCMHIVDKLEAHSSVSRRDIFLVLKKIKTNLSFAVLAYEFSISESQASRIFKSKIHTLAEYLKQLIVWPEKKEILWNLPIQFRFRYATVQSIIDCFEIEIEKPSSATFQAITYSLYKKCNTAKYLISTTPCGLITYISKAACGRNADMEIVKHCGYLDKIPANADVLADRGFKQLDTILHKMQCQLHRPPSVYEGIKSSKKEVKQTRQVASLRIHVERTINRIRNFQLLDKHTRTDKNLSECLDSAVVIGAALVNLQTPIIRQS